MIQRVIEYMPSPLQRGQGVLTLACGHLHSWSDAKGPVPNEADCIHCDDPDYLGNASPEVHALDDKVRESRRKHGAAQGRAEPTPKQ